MKVIFSELAKLELDDACSSHDQANPLVSAVWVAGQADCPDVTEVPGMS